MKEGIKIFEDKFPDKIYKILLTGWKTKVDVSARYYKESYEKHIKYKNVNKKKLKHPILRKVIKKITYSEGPRAEVTEHIKEFVKRGWVIQKPEGEENFSRKGTKFTASLIPYFEYLENNRQIYLSNEKKNFLWLSISHWIKKPVEYNEVANIIVNSDLKFLQIMDWIVKEVLLRDIELATIEYFSTKEKKREYDIDELVAFGGLYLNELEAETFKWNLENKCINLKEKCHLDFGLNNGKLDYFLNTMIHKMARATDLNIKNKGDPIVDEDF